MEVGEHHSSQVPDAVDLEHCGWADRGLHAALLPIDKLSELVNMGTLLAFGIVCAGVWILRRRNPNLHRPFKTPLVPLVPILGILSAAYLIWTLPSLTKIVVIGWLLVGLGDLLHLQCEAQARYRSCLLPNRHP